MYTVFALTGLIITLIICTLAFIRNRKGQTGPVKFISAFGSFIDRHYLIFLLLIFVVFIISRVLKIESFPNGIHIDELSMATDAKSILLNGTDRGGIHWPPYFQNYGGGQNALYIYIQSFILSFLPATIFAFRIQAVFWGAVCFVMVFAISYELTKSRGYALIGPALATTLPVYVMSQRWGLESYQLLPFSAIVLYLAIRAVKYQKSRDFILTGVFMGASLYTYAVTYILWPIFLFLAGIYLIRLKKITLKQTVIMAVPLAVLAFPLILFQLVNFGLIGPMRLGISDYIPLPVAREEELSLSNIFYNLRFFKGLFLGGESLTYNVFPEFGTIYLFLLPFVIAGFVIAVKDTIASFKNKEFSPAAFIVFFWLGGTIFMLLVKAPNVNRVNELFIPFLLFIVISIHRIFSKNALTLTWLATWTGASFVFFMYFYFFMQNAVYGVHPLHTSATPGKAIVRCEKYYCKDENTHIYIQFEDIAEGRYQQVFYFAGRPGDVYSEDDPTYGRVTAGLPEEFDLNEDAIYIIGDQWPHITSYLISEGFIADQTLPGYSILWRLNN